MRGTGEYLPGVLRFHATLGLAIGVAICGCAGNSGESKDAGTESGSTVSARPEFPPLPPRTFQIDYGVTLEGLPKNARVKVWFPAPQTTDHQQITRLGHQAPVDPQVTSDETYGNRILHFETHSGPKNSLGFQVSWRVTRREVRAIDAPGDPVALSERHKALFLEANSRVPISGKPLELIEETRLPDSDPLALGRVFYDRVNDHMKYDKSRPGYGNGDVLWACDSRFGNCTDFHSLFISLARSQGLPAKFEIGFPLPPQRGEGQIGGYHCWAQFYIDGHGWVPTDISEADKDPRRESYYYGNLTENRVQFTTGRDIVLVPPQSGKPLNYFIYPHVEVNGQPWPTGKTRRRFTYKDLET